MNYSKKDIDKFFEGKLSKKEAKDFLNWLESPAGTATYNAIIEEVWAKESSDPEIPAEIDDAHLRIKAVEGSKPAHELIISKSISDQKPKIKKWLGLAASLFLVLSFSILFHFNSPTPQPGEPIPTTEPVAIIKSTPRGNKKLITLPDGSKVTLNADSKLTYNDDFVQNRTIPLEGEAFFDVVKDENHPFTVITNNIATTALGTSFNIKAYDGNSDIRVILATGKVKVENSLSNKHIEIQPGEAVYYFGENKTFERQHIDLAKALSWKEGILQFDKVPFDEIITDLERWYGVDIHVKGTKKIPKDKCTGTFNQNEYLSNVLKVLSYSVDFKYTINGNIVLLDFK